MIGRSVITDKAKGSVVPLGLDLAILYTTKTETDEDLTRNTRLDCEGCCEKENSNKLKAWGTFGRSKVAYECQAAMDRVDSYCEVVAYSGQKHGFFNYRVGEILTTTRR